MKLDLNKFMYNKKKIFIFLLLVLLLIFALSFCLKTDKTIALSEKQIVILTENIRNFYKNKPNAWGLNTYSAIQNKIVPHDMLNGRQIKNGLGKDVLLGSDLLGNTVMPGSKTFAIVYKNLNKKECIAISSYAFSEKMMISFDEINIVNDKTYSFRWGAENALPITDFIAKKTCRDNNDIVWNIYL